MDVLRECGNDVCALDFETTGLDPSSAEVRLTALYNPKIGAVVIDHSLLPFSRCVEFMGNQVWTVYNAKFETAWFDYVQRLAVTVVDVDFIAKVKRGGGHSSLKVMAKRDLGIELDKSEQVSDWSTKKLTDRQIMYAAKDAIVTWMLYEYWVNQLSEQQEDAVFVLNEAVRPTLECEETGMVLDTAAHTLNIQKWKKRMKTALFICRRFTPEQVLGNLGSDKQVSDYLLATLPKEVTRDWPRTEAKKQLKLDRPTLGPIAAKSTYPFSRWANALLRVKFYKKYLSTYGETLLTKQYLENKITYRLNIAAAATLRYSSSSINIQNIPRAPWIRAAFLPPDGYDWFVTADYSGIELRVLAELSGDEQLLEDAIYGNVHAESASAIYGIPSSDIIEALDSGDPKFDNIRPYYSELRSKAKGFSFQLTYGAQALALSLVLKCTVEEAEDAISKWAARYPKAYSYRFSMFDIMSQTGSLLLGDGREIYVHRNDRTLPVAANYGVQSMAAMVMMRAMARVMEERDRVATRLDVALVATVHDEMILAASDTAAVPYAKQALVKGMIDGWLDVFPDSNTDNLVEAKVGANWGAAK